MTTPNFNNPSTPGITGTPDTAAAGMSSSTPVSQPDDVSFSRTHTSSTSTGTGDGLGSHDTMDTMKDSVSRGVESAQDAFGQLQAKASDLTSRMINNVDLDDLTQKLEQQVREHPARTLLMAAGAGFLLGRAAKRS